MGRRTSRGRTSHLGGWLIPDGAPNEWERNDRLCHRLERELRKERKRQLPREALPRDEVRKEAQLLRDWEDEWSERRDVALERVARYLHNLAREAHAADAL